MTIFRTDKPCQPTVSVDVASPASVLASSSSLHQSYICLHAIYTLVCQYDIRRSP